MTDQNSFQSLCLRFHAFRSIALLHLNVTFIQKLFDFGHFFEWVEFHFFVYCEKTIYSKTMIFAQIKFPFSGFKLTPERKMCVFCVSRYNRLV